MACSTKDVRHFLTIQAISTKYTYANERTLCRWWRPSVNRWTFCSSGVEDGGGPTALTLWISIHSIFLAFVNVEFITILRKPLGRLGGGGDVVVPYKRRTFRSAAILPIKPTLNQHIDMSSIDGQPTSTTLGGTASEIIVHKFGFGCMMMSTSSLKRFRIHPDLTIATHSVDAHSNSR